MTEQELEELDKRLTAARRLSANIKQAELHVKTLQEQDVYSDAVAKAVRGLDVIRAGTADSLARAMVAEAGKLVEQLRAELAAL